MPSIFTEHSVGVTNCEPHKKCGGTPAQVIGSSTERFALYIDAEEDFVADPPDALEIHRMVDDSLLLDTGCARSGNANNWQLWLEEKNFAYLVQHRKHIEMLAAMRTAVRRGALASKLEAGETVQTCRCTMCLREARTTCEGRGGCGLHCARIW